MISQWVWTLRLELGHQLKPQPLRTTEFAPAIPPQSKQTATHPPSSAPASGYGPPTTATRLGKQGASPEPIFLSSLTARSVVLLGSLFIPMSGKDQADGSLRVVYAASIRNCRPCPLREQCQWQGSATAKPRQGSRLFHPLGVGPDPLRWRDWSRRQHRRACIQLLRHQRVEILSEGSLPPLTSPSQGEMVLSRAQRAHARLSWEARFARNARVPMADQVTIKLFGVPKDFATFFGLLPT